MKRIALISLMIVSLGLAFALTCAEVQFTEIPGTGGTYPSLYENQTVTVTGIVTNNTFGTSASFPQGKFFISDPAGGPWSGLYVFRFGTGVQVGDLVSVNGKIIEYYGMTEFAGTSPTPIITIISSGNQLPTPALIQTNVMSSPANPAMAEQWESCYVKVQNVSVTTAPNSYQEFYVTDGSGPGQIDNGCYPPGHAWTGINIGRQWAEIRGIVDYSFNIYGLNPRSDADMQTTANEDNVVTILPDAKLIGNFPNPFAGNTVIAMNLKSVQLVQVEVFNLKGQKVRTLVNGKLAAQLHNISFDGKGDNGNHLPSGVYMYKMTAGNTVESRKLVIR